MQKQQGWVLTSPDLVFANFYFFHFFPRHFLQQYRRHRIHSFTNTKHTTTLVAAAVKKRTEGRGGGVAAGFGGWTPVVLHEPVRHCRHLIIFFSQQLYIWWKNDKGFLFRHIKTEKALIGVWCGLWQEGLCGTPKGCLCAL